jgi:CBS domain-containing protein
VTLMMLGGVSSIDDVERPRLELGMALAGPIASLVMAGILYAIFRVSAGWPPDLRFGLFYLAEINLVIGVFNLLPAFPMDGGRVLRSALAGRLGRLRATRVAAGVGKAFAIALGLFGLLSGGWWLILIAAFVYWGGEAESRALLMKQAVKGLKVRDLLVRRLVMVPVSASAADAAAAMLGARRAACLVVDGEELRGIVCADDLSELPVRSRDGLSVTAVMRPPVEISIDEELISVLKRFQEERLLAAAVREAGALAGTLEQDDIARGLALRQRIGAPA